MKTYLFLTKFLLLIVFLPLKLISSDFYYEKIANENPQNFIDKSICYFYTATYEDKPCVLFYKSWCWTELHDNRQAAGSLLELEQFLDSYSNNFIASKMYSRMAFLYILLGYKFKSKGMFIRSEQCIYKIDNFSEYQEAQIILNFYKAMVSSKSGDRAKALYFYKKADKIYMFDANTISITKRKLGHCVAVNIGDLYMDSNNLKKALYYNVLALRRYANISYSGTAYQNIAMVYSKMKDDQSALVFYKKSIKSFNLDKNIEYLNLAYDSIRSIYLRRNDEISARYYLDMQRKTISKLESRDDFSIELQKNEEDNAKVYHYIWAALILVPLVFLIYKYHNRLRIKRIPAKIEEISGVQKPDDNEEILNENDLSHIKTDLNTNVEFQEKLATYESTMFFLRPDVTLATVAVKMNTSTQNISELINSTKQMNFNTYINTLRINYIMKLLKDEPGYRAFKIAYLAEICGFLSHSTFTKVFKNIKGFTPSEYIEMLNAIKENDNHQEFN